MIRFAVLTLAAALAALAAPTRILDTMTSGGGSPANGTCVLTWPSFRAADGTSVTAGARRVAIRSGVVDVILQATAGGTPTSAPWLAPAYTAACYIAGSSPVTEYWQVPVSGSPVTLSAVRQGAPGQPGGGGGASLPSGSGALRVSAGAAALVAGTAGDCVKVDGSSGACGGGQLYVEGEYPTGAVNGSNAAFTLAQAPTPASSLALYRNGILQAVGIDYALSGTAITFLAGAIPQSGDLLQARYRYGIASPPPSGAALPKGRSYRGNNSDAAAEFGPCADGEIEEYDASAALGVKCVAKPLSIAWPTGSGVVRVISGTPTLVPGTAGDCVKVDGSSGACGNSSGAMKYKCISTTQSTRTATGPFSTGCTVPAATLAVGDILTVDACGLHGSAGAVIKYGIAVVGTSPIEAGTYVSSTGLGWCVRAVGVVQAAGISGTLVLSGTVSAEAGPGTYSPGVLRPTAVSVDTTAAATVAPTVYLAGTGTSTLHSFSVIVQ